MNDDKHIVIVVPGFIQGPSAVHASSRSLLRALEKAGLQAQLACLPGRGAQEGATGFHFADYVELLDDEVHRSLLKAQRVSIIGHSLGGLLSACLPQHTQAQLFRRVIVGSPLAPSFTTALAPIADALLFSSAKLLHHLDIPFPGAFFGKTFHKLRPLLNRKGIRFPLQVWAPGSFESEDWAEVLCEGFVADSFGVLSDLLHLNLSRGTHAGRLEVAPRIASLEGPPTLVLAGDADAIAPAVEVENLFLKIGAREKQFLLLGVESCGVSFGHIDLLIGKFAPRFVWPRILRFLLEESSTRPL